MKRVLRSVPWVKPAHYHRPSRRVSPKRERGLWTIKPDSRIEAMDAWLDGHHRIKALLMALVLAPAFTVVCIWGWLIIYGVFKP